MPEEVSPEVARGMPRDKINFPSNPRDASHEERETDVWKAVWMPWALDDEEARKKAYKDLLDCDFAHLLLNSPGTQHMLASGPEYGRMLSELKFDPMALDKAAKSGHACGIMAAAALAKEMLRKRALPKNKPEKPPESATEAKAYATKLFSCKKFAHAADMYALAINLVDMRPPVTVSVETAGMAARLVAISAAREPPLIECTVKARPRTNEYTSEVSMLSALYANLAACRVKQHRWPEVISACDMAITLNPLYAKALLRRGEAKRRLHHLNEARRDAGLALSAASEVDAASGAQ